MAKASPIRGLDVQAPVAHNARVIAKARLEDLYEWDEYVASPYRVRELHNLRIAAKRLRYTLEIFAYVLPPECQQVVEELTKVQDEVGALHDSDVMIALLRLCLGSQDSGPAYEDALLAAQDRKQHGQRDFTLPPELVADVLEPMRAPSADERYGLEQMLLRQQQAREEQYATFRQHWYALKARDFRHELMDILAK